MRPPASGSARIDMAQATQDRHRSYSPLVIPCGARRRCGHRLLLAPVRPCPIEVDDMLAEHAVEPALAEDEQVVEALAPRAAQGALAHRIRPGRTMGRAQDADAAGCGDARAGGLELAVVARMGYRGRWARGITSISTPAAASRESWRPRSGRGCAACAARMSSAVVAEKSIRPPSRPVTTHSRAIE